MTQLRDSGVFLIDLKPDPIVNSRASLSELRPQVLALVHRVAELETARIVLIKTDVYDAAYSALADAALPVSKVRIPSPSSGRQTEFAVALGRALARE